MTGDCVFCAIVAGESPAQMVPSEIRGVIAFVPRRHVVDAAADPGITGWTFAAAAHHAAAQDRPHNLLASAGEAATQSVFHLHVHYVPRAEDDGLLLPWGTLHGEDPKAPHRCRRTVDLERQLAEVSGR